MPTSMVYFDFIPTKEEEEKSEASGEFPLKPIRSHRVEIHNTPSKPLDLFTPWECKKVLIANDVSGLGGLVLGREHVQQHWGLDWKALNGGDQIIIPVRDVDMRTEHKIFLRKYNSDDIFIIHNNWMMDFVYRRDLKEGDTIGMYWNRTSASIFFSVLKRAFEMHYE
ncbi:B3 domain-containing protein [Thalictrum thalictroides]|uniref:B3 domain-containing protein n=1 Tax=Thalictrum thalictroides TaxID=46969 RepID=A0A7J6VMX4_THATH|nr:B3 domain-containing protein [Thalictrum thalictroides]